MAAGLISHSHTHTHSRTHTLFVLVHFNIMWKTNTCYLLQTNKQRSTQMLAKISLCDQQKEKFVATVEKLCANFLSFFLFCQTSPPLDHLVKSNGTFCTDNLPARSSSSRSRCWEELGDSSKRWNEFEVTGKGPCWESDWCRGWGRHRHWTPGSGSGWGRGSKAGSSCRNPPAPLRVQGCC